MSFKSLDKVLNAIAQQPGWEEQRQLLRIIPAWEQIVKPEVAQNTRILSIVRQVLWIATSSSSWSHTLTMQRYQLKQQLNTQLSLSLKDLRFSEAQWYRANTISQDNNCDSVHPSQIKPIKLPLEDIPPQSTPQEALSRWLYLLEMRSHNLPLCPRCQTPTPLGEIERWSMCAHCFSREVQ